MLKIILINEIPAERSDNIRSDTGAEHFKNERQYFTQYPKKSAKIFFFQY